MKKWILVSIVALAGGVFAWKYSSTLPEQDSDFLAYVPGDTIYYFGGTNNNELTEFMLDAKIFTSPTQEEQMSALLDNLSQDNDSAPVKFFSYLFAQSMKGNGGTVGDVMALTGAKKDGSYAFYSDGIFPVIRSELEDTTRIEALIEDAVKESGWQYEESALGNGTLKLWQLAQEEGTDLKFGIALNSNTITISVLEGSESEADKLKRFAAAKPQQSLATTGEIAAIKQQRGYNDAMIGFFHLARIVDGLVDPKANSFGQHIKTLLPSDGNQKLSENLTEACRQDYKTMATKAPRILTGYQDLSISGNTLNMVFDLFLEINDSSITGDLIKIRGHIPAHATDSSDKLMSIGFGLDFNSLAPALTSLWNAFISAQFTCDKLIATQEKVKQNNPAMLAMFTGMAQGVKGLGASIYDVKMTEGTPIPSDLSALISIAADQPEALVALTAMVPNMSGLNIPTDGSLADINLPMVPPEIKIKAGISGKQLVIFTGDKAAKEVEKVANEALEANGLMSIGMDYRKLESLTQLSIPGVTQVAGQNTCVAQKQMQDVFNNMQMDIGFTLDITEQGIDNVSRMSWDKPNITPIKLGGRYTLEILNENCEWEKAGVEVINTDGTGQYEEQHENGECLLYSTKYNWKKEGSNFVMNTSEEKSREQCSDEWDNVEPEEYSCFLLNAQKDSFQCLFDANTEDATIYRYTRS